MTNLDNFIDKFREQLKHVDNFIAVALNAHLEIEGDLDEYLKVIFAEPRYLEEARLSFFAKLAVARAYTPISHDRPEWEMMSLVNAIRNKIAHRSRDKVLQVDLSRLRSVLNESFEMLRAELKDADSKDIMTYSAAICCGFLALLEEQVAQTKRVRISEDDDE